MMFKRLRIILPLPFILVALTAPAATDQVVTSEQPICIDRPAPPTPSVGVGSALTAKPWRIEELVGEPLADDQRAPYLLFTDAGDLMGFGGCNFFTGKIRTGTDGKIVVSSLRASHRECTDSDKRENTLLTSLMMANILRENNGGLTFFMDGNSLVKLRQAPDISVDELIKQANLLKAHKKRPHKSRSKKKKVITKSKNRPKTDVPKTSRKARPAATKSILPH